MSDMQKGKIETMREAGHTVLKLSGALYRGDRGETELNKELHTLAKTEGLRLLIDLSETTKIDSSIIGTLVSGFAAIEKNDGHMAVHAGGHVKRMLDITKLSPVLGVTDSRESALAALSGQPDPEKPAAHIKPGARTTLAPL
ncbi:MAG: STAS domain-containing protein [Pseudomonadota bacterium]|nr:STAS domain-containing protein [Pseudomonadota bacterium]